MAVPGLIIAAPASGSGKTLVTLGLLSALRRRGMAVASAKVGPDYIDPGFHAAATGRPCLTLDAWAMREETLAGQVDMAQEQADIVVCEGVMGLFDGASVPAGQRNGSTAEIAALTGWPVILVVDARSMAASAAAIVAGFARLRADVRIGGVIFNRVAGQRHAAIIADACAAHVPEVKILGFLPRNESLAVPGRHLGLVQACEHPDLAIFYAHAADMIAEHVDLDALSSLASPAGLSGEPTTPVPPLGQRIAVAQDQAFAFSYPATLAAWRRCGAEILPFSPLADQSPPAHADAVYLPGGYPELHAGRLAAAERFMTGLRNAAQTGCAVFGECGGYMVLGRTLTDADGIAHPMANLLAVSTSFAHRRLHLGYRRATLVADTPLGRRGQTYRGHEFHYATEVEGEGGDLLFALRDAAGTPLPSAGRQNANVAGSFVHLIDADTPAGWF